MQDEKNIFESEKEFINYIRIKYTATSKKLLKTFGEDCAVIKMSSKRPMIISCDDFIEGKHFLFDYFTLKQIGQKALLVNISDIISMGAKPLYYLVSLHLPSGFQKERALEIYEGFYKIAKSFKMKIIGGNTEVYEGPLSINITIVGEPLNDKLLYRSNAKAGDFIFLSGKTGFAALGLKLLQQGWKIKNNEIYNKDNKKEKNKYFLKAIREYINPSIPYKLCFELAKKNIANAAIDISDGLISDMYEICKESNVSCILEKNKIFDNPSLNRICNALGIDFFFLSLSGGDDYQLLFTVPKQKIKLLKSLEKKFKFYHIGEIVGDVSKVVKIKDDSQEKILSPALGYDQFRN